MDHLHEAEFVQQFRSVAEAPPAAPARLGRSARCAAEDGIDLDRADLQRRHCLLRVRKAGGQDRGREPVAPFCGQAETLFEAVDHLHRGHGTEGLLAEYLHGRSAVQQDRGRIVCARTGREFTALGRHRSEPQRLVHLPVHCRTLPGVHQRSNRAVTVPQPGFGNEPGAEGLRNGAVDVDPFHRCADLPAVAEGTDGGLRGGPARIDAGIHQQRIVAAVLQNDVCTGQGRGTGNPFPGRA